MVGKAFLCSSLELLNKPTEHGAQGENSKNAVSYSSPGSMALLKENKVQSPLNVPHFIKRSLF